MARTKKLATAKAAPNPGPIEKPKGHCSIKGIAQEWDGIIELRDRVREGGPILDPRSVHKQLDINQCVINHALLSPLAACICVAERKLPTIDDLRDELVCLLTLNKRQGEDLVVMVEDTAKHVKGLCTFLKLKVRRKEVSTATWT